MLFPTNAQGSGFLLNTQQHCFQGKGEREEPLQLRCLEKCFLSMQFSQQVLSKIVAYRYFFSISDENLLRVQAGVEKKSAKKGHIISNFLTSFLQSLQGNLRRRP